MGFNFPDTPTLGALYQPVGGPQYTWDGQKWVMSGSAITYTPAYNQRNRMVNGAMQISQENGNTLGTTQSYFAADQWTVFLSFGGALSFQRVQVLTPKNSSNRVRLVVTTADAAVAAGDLVQIYQQLEGIRVADFQWGTPQAKQVILRFGFKAPTGAYGMALQQAGGSHAWTALINISAAQANTDTEQIFIIPGPTVGTWAKDNTVGVSLVICPMAGSTYVAPSPNVWVAGGYKSAPSNTNGMATVGNTFELFDVGLYLDVNNSGIPPTWEMPDEPTELIACQRYWHRDNIDFNTYSGAAGTAETRRFGFPTSMRVPPGITESGLSAGNNTLQAFDTVTVNGFRIWVAVTAAGGLYRTSVFTALARM